MTTIHLEVTNKCNLACAYCYARERRAKDKPGECWINFIHACSSIRDVHFVVTGGEPLLRPDICDILASAQSSGICELYTNGTHTSEVFIAALAHVDMVRISIDGATPGQYAVTRNSNLFHNVRANIVESTNRRIPLSVQMTVTELNVGFCEDVVCFLEGMGVDRVYLSPELTYAASAEQYDRILALADQTKASAIRHACVVRDVPVGFQHPRWQYLPGSACGVFRERFFITCDGFLAGCPLLSGPSHCRDNLFHSAATADGVESAFRRASKAWAEAAHCSPCNQCAHLSKCGGWCPGVRGGVDK